MRRKNGAKWWDGMTNVLTAQPCNILSAHISVDEFVTYKTLENVKQRDWLPTWQNYHEIVLRSTKTPFTFAVWHVCWSYFIYHHYNFILNSVIYYLIQSSFIFSCICIGECKMKYGKKRETSSQYWAFAILFIRLHFVVPIREDRSTNYDIGKSSSNGSELQCAWFQRNGNVAERNNMQSSKDNNFQCKYCWSQSQEFHVRCFAVRNMRCQGFGTSCVELKFVSTNLNICQNMRSQFMEWARFH